MKSVAEGLPSRQKVFWARKLFPDPRKIFYKRKVLFNWDPIVTLRQSEGLLRTFIHPMKTPWGPEKTPCYPIGRKLSPTCFLQMSLNREIGSDKTDASKKW